MDQNTTDTSACRTSETSAPTAVEMDDAAWMRLNKWLKSLRHLPRFFRDFHDQKDVFKAIEARMGRAPQPYEVSWVNGQVYVIDTFLRFMAMHGYTLQRTRKRLDFYGLEETVEHARAERQEHFAKVFGLTRADQSEPSETQTRQAAQ